MRFAHRLAPGLVHGPICPTHRHDHEVLLRAALNIENPVAGTHAEPGISSIDKPALLNSESPITGIHIHPGNRQLDKHPELGPASVGDHSPERAEPILLILE